MRMYLQDELQSHAQDTATSLGLSLSTAYKKNDKALMLSMVDAIFDRGYYQEIKVNDINNTVIIQRVIARHKINSPQWFINLINLPAPKGQSLIMDGWLQKGIVTVTSYSGYAYQQLWHTAVDALYWFLLMFLIAVLLSVITIYFLLKPLKIITHQANELAQRKFIVEEKLPRTPELRSVALAMNSMIIKIRSMFEEQSVLTENFQKQAYQDAVTGLGNRRFFDKQLQQLLSGTGNSFIGTLLLLEVSSLKKINEDLGYQAGDEFLINISKIIKDNCLDLRENILAHFSGGNFAIIAPQLTEEEAEHLATCIIHGLEENIKHYNTTFPNINAHIGIATIEAGKTASELLSLADTALRTAQTKGSFGIYRYATKELSHVPIRTAGEWHQFLKRIIDNRKIIVQYQPVMRIDKNEILHYEALLRIADVGVELMTAAVILPMAERFGITHLLDKLVIEQVINKIKKQKNYHNKYAINISHHLLSNDESLQWLFQQLQNNKEIAPLLIFELPEYIAINNLELVKNFIHRLSKYGATVSLDHFGRSFAGFGYLKSLPIAYLKIDGSYVLDIENKDVQFFISFLTKIAHTLDILVIASYVETSDEREILKGFDVDGVQGLLLGAPSE